MPNAHSQISRATRLIDWLFVAALVLALIAYAYLGSYSRYMADDYSALRSVTTHGFFGAQVSSYLAWTGRFSFTFVNSVVALLGPTTPRFVPGLLLTLWFAATVWAIYGLHSSAKNVLILAGFIIFATLETAPNVSQSLYWQTGALTYIAPFIPLSLFIGIVSRGVNERNRRFFNLLCAGVLMLVAGGFSDAYVVSQSCGLLLSILAVEMFADVNFKSRIRPFLLVGLAGSLIALAIVAAAPGNSIRQTYFQKQIIGWDVLVFTITYSIRFMAKLVVTHPLVFIAALTLPLSFALRDNRPSWDRRLCIRLILFIPVAVFVLIACCTATSVYAISVMLPERARILLSLTFVCGTLVWSGAAGEYLAGKLIGKSKQTMSLIVTLALLLLTCAPLMSLVSNLGKRDEARTYAADWDRQDAELKSAKQIGVANVTVQQIGDFQSRIGNGASDLHLRTDPSFWINQTTAAYYGLRSVRASEDVAISR